MANPFELERKRQMLAEMEARVKSEEAILKANNDDPLKGWSEKELQAVERHPEYREKAEESRLSRKIREAEEKKIIQNKRMLADLKVQSFFPEASTDPTFNAKINNIIDRYGLHNNPNARFIAAKLAREE